MTAAKLVVDSRVRVALTEISAAAATALRREFTHSNPTFHKRAAMGLHPTRDEPPVIRTWSEERGVLALPRGGMSRVRAVLRDHGVVWSVDDRRTKGPTVPRGYAWPSHRFHLYPDQESAVASATEKQNCLIRSPTGSGKTSSAIAMIARLKVWSLVVVWSGALFEQWVDRLQDELSLPRARIGTVRGQVSRCLPITVAMQQTLARVDSEDAFFQQWGLVVADEVDRFAARTFFPSVDPFTSHWRIGIGASEKRKDRKEFLVYDLFGQPAAVVEERALVASGRVLPVSVDVVRTAFAAPWYSGGDAGYTRLLEEMAADPARNALAVAEVKRLVHQGHRVLVLSQRREHCRMLEVMLGELGPQAGLMIGGDDYRDEFRRTKEGMRAGSVLVGIGTVHAVGRGVDMPSVSRVVAAMPLAANRQNFMQAKGRVCRVSKGKSDARMSYLWDDCVFGERHLRNLVAWSDEVLVEGTPARDYLRAIVERPAGDGFFEGLVADGK